MPTIKEVAAAAGVSPSTVSNVFVGQVPVRESTRLRVLTAAEELGYRPHGPAQALRTGRSMTLGLYISFTTNPTMASVIHGVSDGAYAAGYALTICAVENEAELEQTYLDVLARQRVAAVVAFTTGGEPAPYLALQQAGIPVVALFRRPAGVSCDVVFPDYRAGTRAAAQHLLRSGRKRIALLIGRTAAGAGDQRVQGFLAAHTEAGLAAPDDLICGGLYGGTGAREAVECLMRADVPPDAMVVCEAGLTIGALGALRDRSVKIPDDLAFVGAGDMEWARLFDPPLSMIEVNGEQLGRRAVAMALDRLAGDVPSAPRLEALPVRVVFRQSSAAGGHPRSVLS